MNPRLHNLDALRGFALPGIMMVNIVAMADPYMLASQHSPRFDGALDTVVRFAVHLLFEAKFYVLFACLFGYSFALQQGGLAQPDTDFKARMRRRAAGLALLGVLHGCLLYPGDVLVLYALLSVPLLAWCQLPPPRALRRAVWLVGLSAAVLGLMGAALALAGQRQPDAAADVAARLAAFRGSAGASQARIMGEFPAAFGGALLVMGPSVLAMFLCGYVAGRARLLEQVASYRQRLPRVLALGLLVGLPGAVALASAQALNGAHAGIMLAMAGTLLTAPFLTAAYVALLLMVFASAPGARLQAALAPMGRMALSNYLLQSLVTALLCTGYGLRLVDRLAPLALVGVVLLTGAAQMALSACWLARFRYGPAEAILRSITHWRAVTPARPAAGQER